MSCFLFVFLVLWEPVVCKAAPVHREEIYVTDGMEAAEADAEQNGTEAALSDALYAKAAVLLDADSGRILFEKNGEEYLPVASTTKIMTCILALEQGNPEALCQVSSYAAAQPAVRLGLRQGQQFYLRDLLYAMMLESDNDAAVVVAEHISGSVEAFADLMNEKAKELGMENSYFVTPNGLDQNGNGSTAADMARLSAYAIENDDFLKIIATPVWSFTDKAGTGSYSVINHDVFLDQRAGALGIKTGYTGAAGYCFAGAVYAGGKRLIAVVLATGWPPNKTRKWSDMARLMEYGMDHYEKRSVLTGEPRFARLPVQEGKKGSVNVSLEGELALLLKAEDQVRVTYSMENMLEAPVQEGTVVGQARVTVNETVVASYPLTVTEADARLTYRDYLETLIGMIFP